MSCIDRCRCRLWCGFRWWCGWQCGGAGEASGANPVNGSPNAKAAPARNTAMSWFSRGSYPPPRAVRTLAPAAGGGGRDRSRPVGGASTSRTSCPESQDRQVPIREGRARTSFGGCRRGRGRDAPASIRAGTGANSVVTLRGAVSKPMASNRAVLVKRFGVSGVEPCAARRPAGTSRTGQGESVAPDLGRSRAHSRCGEPARPGCGPRLGR